MIPGSFFLKRCSDEWLVSKPASRLFAAASLVTVVMMTPIGIGYADRFAGATLWKTILLALLAVASVLGSFFLWGGMWRYWARLDPSAKPIRTAWFVVLIICFWYGAILYYLFVYRRRKPNALPRAASLQQPVNNPFRVLFYFLVTGWTALLGLVALCFAFPKPAGDILVPGAPYFTMIPILLIGATGLYRILRFYRAGMTRTNL